MEETLPEETRAHGQKEESPAPREKPRPPEDDLPPEPSDRLFTELFWILIVLTAITRLAWLTERPFHHDESIHAYFSLPSKMGGYRYDPVYHAPFYHYVMYLFLYLFGASDFVARLSAVFFGFVQMFAVRPLARHIGRRTALIYGFLLLVSPLVTYYHRFMRMDAPMMAITIWFVVFVANYWKEGDPWDLLWAFIMAALAFTTKENCYITAFIFFLFFVVALARKRERRERLLDLVGAHRLAWAAGLALFALIWVLFYTVFFKYPEDWNGFGKAMHHWLGQQKAGRIANDWWFYFPRLGLYEFFIVASAVAACFMKKARRRPWFIFSAFWTVGALVMYTWARERVPWLAVHIIQPMALVAALGWGTVYFRRKLVWVVGGVGLALTLLTTYSLNVLYPAVGMHEKGGGPPHAEIGAYVQTTGDVRRLLDIVGERGEKRIYLHGEGTWPLAWYFRGSDVDFAAEPDYWRDRVFVVDAGKGKEVLEKVKGRCIESRFRLRAWWMPKPSQLTLRDYWRYITRREAIEPPIGSSNVTLIRCESPCGEAAEEDSPQGEEASGEKTVQEQESEEKAPVQEQKTEESD